PGRRIGRPPQPGNGACLTIADGGFWLAGSGGCGLWLSDDCHPGQSAPRPVRRWRTLYRSYQPGRFGKCSHAGVTLRSATPAHASSWTYGCRSAHLGGCSAATPQSTPPSGGRSMDRPPTIFHLTPLYPPSTFRGDALYVYRLAHALGDAGHRVDVVHCIDAYRLLHPAEPAIAFADHPNVMRYGLRSGYGWLSPLVTQQTGRPFLKARRITALLKS